VLAVVVRGDFGVVLGKDEQETAEIARILDLKTVVQEAQLIEFGLLVISMHKDIHQAA
jgi:hypothetical protein